MSIERLAIGLQIVETDTGGHGLELQPPLTWSIWTAVQTAPDATLRAVFSFSTQAGAGLSGYNLMCLNSKLHFYVRTSTPGATWRTIAASANLTTGQWYHCAGRVYTVVNEGLTTYYMEFWIDGVSQGTTSWESRTIVYAAHNLQIGSYTSNNINCYVQDFTIWNAKISDAQIGLLGPSRLHNMPLMIEPASHKGFWPYDEMNDGESAGTNPKNFCNRSAGTGGSFTLAGSGHAYGRLIPTIYDACARVVSFEAPAAAPSLPAGSLALCGVGR